MIQETIVTAQGVSTRAQIAPMGITRRGDFYLIAPFKPSTTLDVILESGCAVINFTDDVRVFAGCLTGRYDWPLVEAARIEAPRLAEALAHVEVQLETVEEDEVRPRLLCRPVFEEMHRPFQGFNRAQAAVLELAILVSRLDRLPFAKIAREIKYLSIAVEKTAGPREQEAWDWLITKINAFQAAHRQEA